MAPAALESALREALTRGDAAEAARLTEALVTVLTMDRSHRSRLQLARSGARTATKRLLELRGMLASTRTSSASSSASGATAWPARRLDETFDVARSSQPAGTLDAVEANHTRAEADAASSYSARSSSADSQRAAHLWSQLVEMRQLLLVSPDGSAASERLKKAVADKECEVASLLREVDAKNGDEIPDEGPQVEVETMRKLGLLRSSAKPRRTYQQRFVSTPPAEIPPTVGDRAGSQRRLPVDSTRCSTSQGTVIRPVDNTAVEASGVDDLTRQLQQMRVLATTSINSSAAASRLRELMAEKEIELAAAFGRQLAEQAANASSQAASVMHSAKQMARGEVARRRKAEASVLAWQMEAELKGAALAAIKDANAESAAKAAQAAEARERAAAETNAEIQAKYGSLLRTLNRRKN